MRLKDFEAWYDTYGEDLELKIEAWLDNSPVTLSSNTIDTIINEGITDAYECYLGDYGDYLYEQERDRRIDNGC